MQCIMQNTNIKMGLWVTMHNNTDSSLLIYTIHTKNIIFRLIKNDKLFLLYYIGNRLLEIILNYYTTKIFGWMKW